MDYTQQLFEQMFGAEWGATVYLLVKNVFYIFAIVVPLLLAVAYLTFAERKIIAYMQIRVGNDFFGCLWCDYSRLGL